MHNQASPVVLKKTSPLQSLILRNVVKPMEQVSYVLLWSAVTVSVVTSTLQFLVLIVSRVLPIFPHLWAKSFPTSLDHFSSTPMGIFCLGIVLFCWINIYSIKQTKKQYHEFRVWAVSMEISWPGRNGEQHTLTLRHLTMVWSKARKNMPSLRVVSVAVFQCLALLWQRAHLGQSVSSSGTLSVVTDRETRAAVMTVLSEETVSDVCTPTPNEKHSSGIFGTILKACQIRVVGPSGAEKVIDVQYRPYLLLWLYLVALSLTQQWINLNDILRDVYGYDEAAGGDGNIDRVKERKKLLNQFHDHHRVLCEDLNDALVEVGLPKTDLFLNQRRQQNRQRNSFWRLADTIQMQDLALFQQCRTLLVDGKEGQEQIVTACEQFSLVLGDMEMIRSYHETPAIQKVLREILMTSTKALKYLAKENHAAAQKTTDTEAQQLLVRKEEQYWATYALSCAQSTNELPGQYKLLSEQGELALRKALSCCLTLHDRDLADALYQDYQQTKERDGDPWKPETETKHLWQKILAMDEDEVA